MSHCIDEALNALCSGTTHVLSREELKAKLALKRPLRVKLGVDPTAPDIHLGHTVALEKLRQFQELGHHALLLIGDFTARIGDPTGRSAARPPLTRDEVLDNAETYTTQAFKVLDKEKTEVVWNSHWFGKMNYEEVLSLNAQVTLQQMLQREDFKTRLESSKEVRLHEIQYPIMQGWDSVQIHADVELGGTDQLFNILVGRELQKGAGQSPQIAMTVPLLEGLDGVKKMSKSAHNYIGVSEAPESIFGKMMSISDTLMERYYLLLLGETFSCQAPGAPHPMEAKKSLASRIITRYYDSQQAALAQATWERRFSIRDNRAGAVEVAHHAFHQAKNLVDIVEIAFKEAFDLQKSKGEIRRQYIAPGAIQLNEQKLTDSQFLPALNNGDILRLSKKHSIVITP